MRNYVFSDRIAGQPLSELRRADILNLRQRLVDAGTGARTVNRTIGILKIAFKEGVFREELDRNPCEGIGNINYKREEVGTFTAKELQTIFVNSPGPFRDRCEYTVFLLAASCGMRRGELLVMQWRQVNFDSHTILVDRALKSKTKNVIGPPKWGRIRTTFLPGKASDALRDLKRQSHHVLPEAFAFGYPDGSRRGHTWWGDAFEKAMDIAGIDRVGRNLRPHSFRHSANTMLLDAGLDAGKVRAAMGWQGPEVQAMYSHYAEMSLKDLREHMDTILGSK